MKIKDKLAKKNNKLLVIVFVADNLNAAALRMSYFVTPNAVLFVGIGREQSLWQQCSAQYKMRQRQ
jgi:hypothetical protein